MTEMSTTMQGDTLDIKSKSEYFDFLAAHIAEDPDLAIANLTKDMAALDAFDARSQTAQPVTALETPVNEVESTERDDETETNEIDGGKSRRFRKMGRKVLNIGTSINNGYYHGVAWSLGKIPGTKSKEEILEDDRLRQERYAVEEGDGIATRTRKLFGRNVIKAAAWAPVVFAGLAASSSLLRPVVPVIEGLEVKTLPYVTTGIETNFYIGGAGDPDAEMFMAAVLQSGYYDPNDINMQAHYSASIGPVVGVERMDASTQDAANQAYGAYKTANGGPYSLHAFSEGAVGAVKALEMIARDNGGVVPDNVTVYIDGGPRGAMGAWNSPYVQAVSPILDSMGIDTVRDIPPGAHVVIRSYSGDVWGAGGDDAGSTQLAMVVGIAGGAHRSFEGGTLLREKTINGVTYQEFSYPDGHVHPLSEVLEANNIHVSPEGDRFFDKILPTTHLGEETQYANANEVANATGDLIDSSTHTNAGSKTIDGMMKVPGAGEDLQSLLDLYGPLPDHVARMANDPKLILTEGPAAAGEIKAAAHTVGEYIKDPNKFMDLGNAGLQAHGLPALLPHLDPPKLFNGGNGGSGSALTNFLETAKEVIPGGPSGGNANVSDNLGSGLQKFIKKVQEFAPPPPTAAAEVHNDVGVPLAPLPAAPEIPQIPQPIMDAAPKFAELAPKFAGALSNLMGALQKQ